MMSIIMIDPIDKSLYAKTWHINEPTPLRPYEPNRVTAVQADMDELIYIRYNFSNLPQVKNRLVVNYYGDIAKFIAGNLPHRNR